MLEQYGAKSDDISLDGRTLVEIARGEPLMLDLLRSIASCDAIGVALAEAGAASSGRGGPAPSL
jgi:hypothetical protein